MNNTRIHSIKMDQTSLSISPDKPSCVIAGCVKNCENYIDQVFANIEKIQTLFQNPQVIISFDLTRNNDVQDPSLKKLLQIRASGRFDLTILMNKNPLTSIRTVNIENARNKILDHIAEKSLNPDYLIMMDFDDVCAKTIRLEILERGLAKSDQWDALFFNNENYYDYWALSMDEFEYSCWHCSDTKKMMKAMHQRLIEKMAALGSGDLLECKSAFGGFGIYKYARFVQEWGCKYKSLTDLSLFSTESFRDMQEKHGIQFYLDPERVFDCEHRRFHLTAYHKGARLRIAKDCLFPRYSGEHTKILE